MMDDMYLLFTNGKDLYCQNDIDQNNYSMSTTLEKAAWEDGD